MSNPFLPPQFQFPDLPRPRVDLVKRARPPALPMPTIVYYDRTGAPIEGGVLAWAKLYEDPLYRLITRTTVTDSADLATTYDVSTIWLGIPTASMFFAGGVPLIFETKVFGDGSDEFDTQRHATEDLAREGHSTMVLLVSASMKDPIVMDAR
jgi:hypothetical protein